MKIERAIEILNPEHRECYQSIEEVNEACRMGMHALESMKEMQTINIMLDAGAKMPTRAHEDDAGLDLYAVESQVIPACESATFDTGVHVELPHGTVGLIKSKSGLNVKFGLTSDGVIDAGYTGSIVVKLYNNSGYDYKVKAGDKISQLVIVPVLTPSPVLVNRFRDSERGDNGFGSSGR